MTNNIERPIDMSSVMHDLRRSGADTERVAGLVLHVERNASKRLAEISKPEITHLAKEAREAAKESLIEYAEHVLATKGIPQDVTLLHRSHSGEGVQEKIATKRVSPMVEIMPDLAIQLEDDTPYLLNEHQFVRDHIHIKIIKKNTPHLSKSAYTFGPDLTHKDRPSFFDMPSHPSEITIEDIENARKYIELIDLVSPIVDSQVAATNNS